jgi:hypothetical protein
MENNLCVIGIDPGNENSAFALYNGVSFIFKKLPNDDFFIEIGKVIHQLKVDHIYIEGIQSFGMAVGKSVFETAYMIGELKMWFKILYPNLKVDVIYRTDVKMHHCKTTKAKDTNIRQSLIDRFGEVGTKKNQGILYGCSGDMWSAVAIATMCYDKESQR